MMLTIDVCLMPNCFCLKSFVCIMHCVTLTPSCYIYAKLFICQSIDREQIFDVTFEPPLPPIEKSCLRDWLQKQEKSLHLSLKQTKL